MQTYYAIAWGPLLADGAKRSALTLPAIAKRSEWTGHDQPSSQPDPVGPLKGLILAELADGSTAGFAAQPDMDAWLGVKIASAGGQTSDSGFMLVNMMSIPAPYEEEFNAWYDTEHIARLCEVDGVNAALRFRATNGAAPRYVTCYFLSNTEVMSSKEWEKAARTPWTARIGPMSTDRQRMVFSRA